MTTQQKLVELLADGRQHSGEEIAQALGMSRAAVWKQIHQLTDLGFAVAAQPGKGYRLEHPLELLSVDAIRDSLGDAALAASEVIDVRWTTESTNTLLTSLGPPAAGSLQIAAAEFQTAGKGRRGRSWIAPFGAGICVSVGWRFAVSPPNLACLGLAVGVGLLRAMQRLGVEGVELKWPNDVLRAGGKLAGVLIEVTGETDGPLHAVVGVGINYRVNADLVAAVLESGGIAPAGLCPDVDSEAASAPGRNEVIAALINELYGVLETFAAQGFAPFAGDWERADYLAGKPVQISNGAIELAGTAAGISADGQLKVATASGVRHIATGDVRVRTAA
jgi:BirA family biotin operon repressor/biotin-[acetyl-CoA-carboxylase] ligase